jgi:hypothetical protein
MAENKKEIAYKIIFNNIKTQLAYNISTFSIKPVNV